MGYYDSSRVGHLICPRSQWIYFADFKQIVFQQQRVRDNEVFKLKNKKFVWWQTKSKPKPKFLLQQAKFLLQQESVKKFCSKGNLLVFLGFCPVQVSKSTRVLIDYNQYDRFRWVMHIYLQITLSFISAILDSYEITFFFFSFFFVSPFHTWRVYSISKKKSSFQCWN